MISPSPSILEHILSKDEHPAYSPEDLLAQHKEDQTQQLDPKRRHLHPDPSKRAPLDLLSATNSKNRRNRVSQSADGSSHLLVSSSTDLRLLLPEQPASSGYCGMRPSDTSSPPVCAWPPPAPAVGSGTSSHSSQAQQPSPCVAPPSPDSEKKSSRAPFLKSTSTWHTLDFFQTTPPTTTMSKPTRTSGWKYDNLLQPIRSRTNTMPSVRRPPGELWRSDPGPVKASSANVTSPPTCPTPPGLAPRQSDLRRSGVDSDLHSSGSLSLSLALGSQPLRASEHTKAVPPIGAERGQAVSMLPYRNSPAQSIDRPQSPWSPLLRSPRLQSKWNNDIYLLDTTSLEKAQAVAGDTTTSKQDLDRLLRHAVRNKYAPKIISPLSPLRAATPPFSLSTDPEYQLRMPSLSNTPSPRFSRYLPRRARTICDRYQTFDWDTNCMHCPECKRDTLCKRLLAFRHRQYQQQMHHAQRPRLHVYPPRGVGAEDNRIALASRIRETFSYVMDEEEKSLWEEVAAVTGAGLAPFARIGAPCAAATHRRGFDDGADNGTHDGCLEIADEDLRGTESPALFRDVIVY